MNFIDFIIILVFLYSLYIGFDTGVIKAIYDFVILTFSTIIASLVIKLLPKSLYLFLPFINFPGRSQGIKSINIIFWRVIFFILILFFIISIINSIMKNKGIEKKVINLTVTFNSIMHKILGTLSYGLLFFVLLFNVIIVLRMPNLNFKVMHESSISNFIIEKMPLLSKLNDELIKSESYAFDKISGDVTIENYKEINENIINNLVKNDMISKDVVKKLRNDGKIVGERSQNSMPNNNNDDTNNDSNQDNNASNNDNNDSNQDDNYIDNSESSDDVSGGSDNNSSDNNYEYIDSNEEYIDSEEIEDAELEDFEF